MQNWDNKLINYRIADIQQEMAQIRLAKQAQAHKVSVVNRIIAAFHNAAHHVELQPEPQLDDTRRITAVHPRLSIQDSGS